MATVNACKPLPDLEVLESLLFYDKENGRVLWRREKNPQWNGMLAGSRTPRGYQRIKINQSLYLAHRIAWKMASGSDPGEFEVDHIDGDPQNNRPENLRLATHGQNQTNGRAFRNNKCGYRGVYFHSRRRKWTAQINHMKKAHSLGFFDTPEAAAAAYNKAALKLFGEFAKPNILGDNQ